MATKIKAVDLMAMAEQPDARRTVLMNGPRFNTWFHTYTPGQIDRMHCHNADQTFVCLDGECTMHFPDGAKTVLKPGMVALIPGGSFYQLENAAKENFVMIGTRAISNEKGATIDYETREELYNKEPKPAPKGTKVLV